MPRALRAVELYGLFHARKLRAHELALRAGWDRVHARLRLDRALLRLVHAGDRRRRTSPAPAAGERDLDGRWTSSRCAACDAPRRERGALAIVLHTHMPYVEGFGTWPFGEEWLWEAMAGCYLPLLDLLDAARR